MLKHYRTKEEQQDRPLEIRQFYTIGNRDKYIFINDIVFSLGSTWLKPCVMISQSPRVSNNFFVTLFIWQEKPNYQHSTLYLDKV